MRFRHTLALSAAIALVAIAPPAGGQALTPCAPTTADAAQAALAGLQALASGLTRADSSFRALVGIPQMSATSVSFVASETVCGEAARAWAALVGPDAAVRPVWVIAVGPTRYYVFDVRRRTVGGTVVTIFDETFARIVDVLL
jgi:hypothetical protein